MKQQFYHLTPRWNVAAILREGLRPELARGKRPAVWLTTDTTTALYRHIAEKHRCCVTDLVCLTVVVEESHTRQFSLEFCPRGIAYFTGRHIPPADAQRTNREVGI